MNTKQISYKNRNYSYEFDETKPWTNDDAALVNALDILMEYETRHHQELYDKMLAYGAVNNLRQTVEAEFDELEKVLIEKITQTDEISTQFLVIEKVNITELIALHDSGLSEIQLFDINLKALADKMEAIRETIDEDYQELPIEPEWEQFMDIQSQHSDQWEQQSIDGTSFDDMVDEMKTTFSFYQDLNDKYHFYNNEIISNYSLLMTRVSGAYNVWKEYQKRYILLHKMMMDMETNKNIPSLN